MDTIYSTPAEALNAAHDAADIPAKAAGVCVCANGETVTWKWVTFSKKTRVMTTHAVLSTTRRDGGWVIVGV